MTSADDLSEFPAVKDLLQIWGNEGNGMMIEQPPGSDDYTPIDIHATPTTNSAACNNNNNNSDVYSCATNTAQSIDESLDDNRSCDNMSQKRRRVSNSSVSLGCNSSSSNTYVASISTAASGVRIRSSEFIEDYDVILGDPHTPTLGTSLYRQVRLTYAKKNITSKELEIIKSMLQTKVNEKFQSPVPAPTFWYSVKNKQKVKEGSQHRYLKTHIKKGAFGVATDQAIIADVRNAPKRSRKKSTFCFQGSLPQVIALAKERCEEWVGNNPDKELYAKSFKEDVARLIPWHQSVDQAKSNAEGMAAQHPDLKQTHLRQARIHDIHSRQLDATLVTLVNQLGNDMLERYRLSQKKEFEDRILRDCDSLASSIAASREVSSSTILPPTTIISQSDNLSVQEGTMSTDALSLDTTEGTGTLRPVFHRPEDHHSSLTQSLSVKFSRSLNVSPHRLRESEEPAKASIPSELRLGGTLAYDGDHSVSSVSKESSAIRSGNSSSLFRPVDAAAAKEIVLANRQFLNIRPGSPADSSLASEDLLADDAWILPVDRAQHLKGRTLEMDSDPNLDAGIAEVPEESVDWNKALQTHLKTLQEREARLRKYHPDTAKSYNNLGHIYCKLGNWNEALHYHCLALEVRESVLGKENLDTVRSYSSVGYVYFKKCDWDEALLYYRMALDVQETVLGKNHVDTARSHKSTAVVLSKKGDWNEALRHHQMALAAREAREQSNETPGAFGRARASWQGRVRPCSIAEE